LIGRESIQWDVDATLAELINERLPEILKFDKEGDEEQIKAVEAPQGEPASEYFNGSGTRGSYALFDSGWSIPDDVMRGQIEAVGFLRKGDAEAAPCLVIRRITGENDEPLCEWIGAPLDEAWGDGKVYRFPWARVDPPPSGSTEALLTSYKSGKLGLKPREYFSRKDRRALFAIMYKEEIQQFEFGLGLSVFELLYDPHLKNVAFRPIRTFRCGQDDLGARMLSVRALRDKRVLLCGAGALGSAMALELGRNGVGHLEIADFDYFEPATARRWVAGLEHFGKDKVVALRDIVHDQYPWTKVHPHTLRIGGCRFNIDEPDQFDSFSSLVEAADCIVDLTAEVSTNHIVADTAMWLGKPLVVANATPGAWGGMVYQWRPDRSEACWMCMRSFLYPESDHLPAADPAGLLQPPGCGSRTFTGTSFDLGEIVNEAMRAVCGLVGESYPETDWQLGICNLRAEDGRRIPPTWARPTITRRKDCVCAKS
jgi:hypothetical protein